MAKYKTHVHQEIRREMRLYKKLNPKATLDKIAEKFSEKIGRKLMLGTVRGILNEKDEISERALEVAKKSLIQKTGKELARIAENRIKYVNKAEAKVLVRLNRQLNTDQVLSPELVRMLKDLTDIRGKILGTLEISEEIEASQEQLKNLENFEQLIDETLKTKITKKITAIRPDPIRELKIKNPDSEEKRRGENSERED